MRCGDAMPGFEVRTLLRSPEMHAHVCAHMHTPMHLSQGKGQFHIIPDKIAFSGLAMVMMTVQTCEAFGAETFLCFCACRG